MLRIQVAQINPTVGDLQGNVQLMLDAAKAADTAQARFVVFPELSLTGYYPGDLLDDASFLDKVEAAFGHLLLASRQLPSLHWVVGLPARHAGPGKRAAQHAVRDPGGRARARIRQATAAHLRHLR
jgi:NAD+ synthase (glutamine-hydrolysing)